MTKEQLLMQMLESGWQWTISDVPGYVCLEKDGYKHLMSAQQWYLENLLYAQMGWANYMGKLGKDI